MSPEPESDKEWRAGAEFPDIRLDGTPGTRTRLRRMRLGRRRNMEQQTLDAPFGVKLGLALRRNKLTVVLSDTYLWATHHFIDLGWLV